jgi:environmental stress-induced protein Ves
VRFDGALAVDGLLPHGPVDDFNVIYDAEGCAATLEILADARVERARGDSTLLAVNLTPAPLAWTSDAAQGTLGERDALWLQPPHDGLALSKATRVALVEIRAAADLHT